jgi:hypothetical protein
LKPRGYLLDSIASPELQRRALKGKAVPRTLTPPLIFIIKRLSNIIIKVKKRGLMTLFRGLLYVFSSSWKWSI